MKHLLRLILPLIALSFVFESQAQCTLTGLDTVYCASDTADSISVSCTGGSGIVSGPGVSNGWFNPGSAGVGTHSIIAYAPGTTYTISTGTFDPDTGSGTSVTLGDDAVTSNLNIGFAFKFFDNVYTKFGISSNGFLFFGSNSANGCCSGQNLPNSSAPNNLIAFAWEDLNPSAGGTIDYFTAGTAPNRRLIMNFNDVPHYSNTLPVTVQVKLYEGCGRIEIHTDTMPTDGGSHTMGIENANGTTAYTVAGRNASSWSAGTEMIRFEPSSCDIFYTNVVSGPDLVTMADSIDCFGDSNATAMVTPTGISPFTYMWSTGATTATASGLGAGTYTVTVTDANGCASDEEATVGSPLPLGGTFNVVNNVCEGQQEGSATVTPTGGVSPYSYAWNDPGASTTATATFLPAGTFTVTITDANGCTVALNTTVGFDNALPVIDLGADKGICPGQSLVLVGPAGFSSYAWSSGGTGLTEVVSMPGVYTLTVTNSAGCSATDDIELTALTPNQVDLGSTQSGPAPITLDAGPGFSTYNWNTGQTTQTLTVTITGDYSVTTTDTNGCQTSDTTKVNIWPNGITDIKDGGFALYPNPASDAVYIQSANAASFSLEIFDMTGRRVVNTTANIQANEQFTLPVSDLATGRYQVLLSTIDKVYATDLIIQ